MPREKLNKKLIEASKTGDWRTYLVMVKSVTQEENCLRFDKISIRLFPLGPS